MKKADTKSTLLNQGIALMLQRGYHNTAIQDVLTAARIPKGSFYHHFRNKEDFGLQAIRRYSDLGYQSLDDALSDQGHPPIERLRRFFEQIFKDWNRRDCREGCLLGNLGQELADVNEAFRRCISGTLDQWTIRIEMALKEAQTRGELSATVNTRQLASGLVDGFEGAALRMKLVKNISPLEAFLNLYFDQMLNPQK